MDFELKDVMDAVGPNASLVFAAWIFLTFLQSRYTAAYQRYRALADCYRDPETAGVRHDVIGREVLLYKRRCQQMRLAVNVGVGAATLLITSLVTAGADVIVATDWLRYVGAACALVGLLMVVVAAAMVLLENSSIQRSIEDELSDLPALQNRTDGRALGR